MTSLIGHKKPTRIFRQSLAKDSLHHAWILAGPKGLGKAGFARSATQYLLDGGTNDGSDNFPCNPDSQTANLLRAGSHPDFRLLQRLGKTDKEERRAREDGADALEEHELKRNITVDQIRGLQSLFTTQSSISPYRVVMIDAIDNLERGAANALLKNLEEPPKNTIFLLVSHAPERLLPTIRSRCQILRFDPLTDGQMREALAGRLPKTDPAELMALIAAGEGAPGKALSYADAGLSELETIVSDIIRTGDHDNALKTDLARKLSLKASTPRYQAFLARAPSLIADHIRKQATVSNADGIALWKEASDLAAMAAPKALDSQAVVFRLCSLMGSLAQPNEAA